MCMKTVRSWIRRDADPRNGAFLCDIAVMPIPVELEGSHLVAAPDEAGLPLDEVIDSDDVAVDSNDSDDYVELTHTRHPPTKPSRFFDDVRYNDDESES